MVKVVIKAKIKGENEITVKIKGENEIAVPMYASTFSDFLILTEDVAKQIKPKLLGYEEEIEVGGGGKVKGSACLVELKVRDMKTKKERKAKVEAVILKGEKYCVLGHETLEKLRMKVNPTTGEFEFI